MQYLQYGLTKIDSVSSATMASEYFLDVNDASENYKYVIVTGSLQCDVDVTGKYFIRLLKDSDPQSARIRLINSGTTNTYSSSSSSDIHMAYYNQGNADYTSMTGDMIHFFIELDYSSTSPSPQAAPYKRRHLSLMSQNRSAGIPQTSVVVADFRELDTPADEMRFAHNAGANITINATSYGIGSLSTT